MDIKQRTLFNVIYDNESKLMNTILYILDPRGTIITMDLVNNKLILIEEYNKHWYNVWILIFNIFAVYESEIDYGLIYNCSFIINNTTYEYKITKILIDMGVPIEFIDEHHATRKTFDVIDVIQFSI